MGLAAIVYEASPGTTTAGFQRADKGEVTHRYIVYYNNVLLQ